ncbi:hypothetical protein WG908_09740 [Sphingobium sp. AN641]|uniref:hypothetical protein n=1 Tax=Sphingobium sp. AN641 TaxID=3133443 RepID=UPI0030BC9D84
MSKRHWFAGAFDIGREIIAEGRHELLAGWFGRHFEPHPSARSPTDGHDHSMAQRSGWEMPGERAPGPERDARSIDHDLDR